ASSAASRLVSACRGDGRPVSGDGLTSQPVAWWRLARLARSEVSPMATPWLTAVAVTMPDEIDLANAETVCQKLCSAMTPGIDLVIADFTMTAFCDARGVRAITRARRYSAESGSFEHRATALQLRSLDETTPWEAWFIGRIQRVLACGVRDSRSS